MMQKLTSRKFWLAVISIVTGIMGVLGANDNAIQTVSSVALILIPAVVYIFAEGKVDAAAVQSAVQQIDLDALVEAIKEYFNPGNTAANQAAGVKAGDKGSDDEPPEVTE